MPDLGKAYVQIVPSAEGISGKITQAISGEATAAGGVAGTNLVTSIIGKVTAAGIGAKIGQLAVDGIKASVSNYANYEQLVGGVETLFKGSADLVKGYAENAYKTAGLSANDYMETVTSFSASLLQSLGGNTEEAAKKADLAITDMSDNANKMGTSMEAIQNAYQGFAKQNYTMLDNLKLGYGGTKTEMERLLQDAEAIKAKQGEVASYSIDSYADIVDAIHVVQTEMGITGTTAQEASETISGSISSMQAAWENLKTGIADENADIEALSVDLAESMATAAENVAPRILQTIGGVADAIIALPDVMDEVTDSTEPWAETIRNAAEVASLLMSDVKDVAELSAGLLGTLKEIRDTIDGILEDHPILQEIFDAVADSFNPLEQAKEKLQDINTVLGLLATGGENAVSALQRLGIIQRDLDEDGFASSAGGAFDAIGVSAEKSAAGMEAFADSAGDAAAELDEEAQKAKDTHDAIIGIASAAIDARYSGDDLRESYNELSAELEKLRETGTDYDIQLAEQKLAMLDLAATNQELAEGYPILADRLQNSFGYSLSQTSAWLIEHGMTAEEWGNQVNSATDNVINSFSELDTDLGLSLEEMATNMQGNIDAYTNWESNIQTLMDAAVASGDTAKIAFVQHMQDMGIGAADQVAAMVEDVPGTLETFGPLMGDAIDAGMTEVYQAIENSDLGSAADSSAQEVLDAFEEFDFSPGGQNADEGLAQGIELNSYLPSNAASNAVTKAYNAADGQTGQFYWAGYSMDSEMASGIYDNASTVISAAKYVAKEAYKAAYDILKGISKISSNGVSNAAADIANAGQMNIGAYYMDARLYTGRASGGSSAGNVINNYITVDGAKDPAAYASELIRGIKLQTRMA